MFTTKGFTSLGDGGVVQANLLENYSVEYCLKTSHTFTQRLMSHRSNQIRIMLPTLNTPPKKQFEWDKFNNRCLSPKKVKRKTLDALRILQKLSLDNF